MTETSQDHYICGCGCKIEQFSLFEGVRAIEYEIDIKPIGAVRMTRRGKFTSPAAQRYLSYKDIIKHTVTAQMRQKEARRTLSAVRAEIIFKMPIPKSWSKKKQRESMGKPHISKPDIDNLIKGCFDAINGICWLDDNQVCSVLASKIYSEQPGINIIIQEF